MKRDTIYAAGTGPQPFRFDASVAEVFDDMIRRSVPGYGLVLQQLGSLAKRLLTQDQIAYDLGTSLGAGALIMAECADAGYTGSIIGVDNSEAMLNTAQAAIQTSDYDKHVQLVAADIRTLALEPTVLIALNYVLQFIAPDERDEVIQRIADALEPDGVLLLSEKILIDGEAGIQIGELHAQFKRDAGYSDMEIAAKRNAIEDVLIAEPLQAHVDRLQRCGFRLITPWLQAYNFVSILAVR